MNPNYRTRTLPRANPADVQEIVKLWRDKHPGKDKGELRKFLYLAVNHWFPPNGPFNAASWCDEDVRTVRLLLENK